MSDFTDQITLALAPYTDATRAVAMRAYMREHFDFLGIPSPLRRSACKELLKAKPSHAQLLSNASALWQLPQREYQYVAIDLLARHWKLLQVSDMPFLLDLALQKPWWDSVDGLAGVVGDVVHRACLLPEQRASAQATMDAALLDASFWRRRIALLHQLGWHADTDETRLFGYARALAHEDEFFIRKAIGWALRDYAWHAPDAVRAFLQEMGTQLSPLSRREAGKHL